MPLARKLRKKKNFIGVCYFPLFSLIIMITSFKRMWPLCELVFIKGRSSGSLVRCFPLFALWDPLTHTDSCRRRKSNCLKLQAMKKSNRNSSYFLLSSWASSLKGFRTSTLVPMFQGNLIAQDHSVRIYFFVLQLQRYKVKVFCYRHYMARDLWVFWDSHIFIN